MKLLLVREQFKIIFEVTSAVSDDFTWILYVLDVTGLVSLRKLVVVVTVVLLLVIRIVHLRSDFLNP